MNTMTRNIVLRYGIFLFICIGCVFCVKTIAAPISNMPIRLMQPDSSYIDCYTSGDEYYHWLHDEAGHMIIQDSQTGYYVYAATNETDNTNLHLFKKTLNIRESEIIIDPIEQELLRQQQYALLHSDPDYPYKMIMSDDGAILIKDTRILNNIIIYIRFADDTNFTKSQQEYSNLFNYKSNLILPDETCMEDYFLEASYYQLYILSSFYPKNNGTNILSYQDKHKRSYYSPYSITNKDGYNSDYQRKEREHTLLKNAINYVKSQIPSSLNLDTDKDGRVDNICFIIKGGYDGHSELLWPHRWVLSKLVYINGKKVYNYNLQLEDYLNFKGLGVLCHEMNHTLGAPDLYHHSGDANPIGIWDLMASEYSTPQHMSAYIKYKYNHWIKTIPEITTSGTYTLNPLPGFKNNCYAIKIPNSKEYWILEYRKQIGNYEKQLPNSGLVIYRVNSTFNGNYDSKGYGGKNDELYVYRPNGTLNSDGNIISAPFCKERNQIEFSATTNPKCFLSNGNVTTVRITNISACEDQITFDVRFCIDEDITFSNTESLPTFTSVTNDITTSGPVVVKDSDSVEFQAGNSVTLNDGFEVQKNGKFTITITPCKNE